MNTAESLLKNIQKKSTSRVWRHDRSEWKSRNIQTGEERTGTLTFSVYSEYKSSPNLSLFSDLVGILTKQTGIMVQFIGGGGQFAE